MFESGVLEVACALFCAVVTASCNLAAGHAHHHERKARTPAAICLTAEEARRDKLATEIVIEQEFPVPVTVSGKVTFSERFATLRIAPGVPRRTRRGTNPTRDLVSAHGPAAQHMPLRGAAMSSALPLADQETRVIEVTGTGELDPVTVIAEVHDDDLELVSVQARADVSAPGLPGQTFSGQVDDVQKIDELTRTAHVRLTVANPEHRLVPEMNVTVAFAGRYRTALTVSQESVVRVGDEAIVYQRLGDQGPCFQPLTVALEPKSTSTRVAVLSGLRGGETLASDARLLTDR